MIIHSLTFYSLIKLVHVTRTGRLEWQQRPFHQESGGLRWSKDEARPLVRVSVLCYL